MELHLRLPGNSPAEDTALATKGAELAVLRSYGELATEPLPPHTNNACDDAGCPFLGEVEIGGVTWLAYLCGEWVEYYRP